MSLPHIIDGETDADSTTINTWIDAINAQVAIDAGTRLGDIEAAYRTAAYYGIPLDGTSNAGAAINTAIEAIDTRTPGGGGALYLPPCPFVIEETITVPTRFRLLGGSSTQSEGLYGGTALLAADGLDDDILIASEWWHNGEIAYIGIDGNKANNTAGSGISIGQMGEASSIHHIMVIGCAEDGIRVTGESTPSSIADCSCSGNGGHGYHLYHVTRHVNLINPSGDGNGGSLICVDGGGMIGAIAFVNIIGIKCESFASASTHAPAVSIKDYAGAVNFLGGTIDGHSSHTQVEAIIREGSPVGTISFQGLRIAQYSTQFKDEVDAANTIALGYGSQTLNGLAGAYALDVSAGRHFVGRSAAAAAVAIQGSGSGTGASVSIGVGTDIRGTISLTTGSGAGTGTLLRLTYARSFSGGTARVALTPANDNAAAIDVYVSINIAYFDVVSVSSLSDSTNYQWHYVVMG